jgi:hypothetical protein
VPAWVNVHRQPAPPAPAASAPAARPGSGAARSGPVAVQNLTESIGMRTENRFPVHIGTYPVLDRDAAEHAAFALRRVRVLHALRVSATLRRDYNIAMRMIE